jgi:hypothetical protein
MISLLWLLALALGLSYLTGSPRERYLIRHCLTKLIKVLAVGLWALLCLPALGLLWVISRFDGIDARRAEWHRRHALECRLLAGKYRRRGGFGDLESAAQLDRLADLFAADAAECPRVG